MEVRFESPRIDRTEGGPETGGGVEKNGVCKRTDGKVPSLRCGYVVNG